MLESSGWRTCLGLFPTRRHLARRSGQTRTGLGAQDLVGEADDVRIVGRAHHRDPVDAGGSDEQPAHSRRALLVQARGRLVGKQDGTPGSKRPCDRDPLALSRRSNAARCAFLRASPTSASAVSACAASPIPRTLSARSTFSRTLTCGTSPATRSARAPSRSSSTPKRHPERNLMSDYPLCGLVDCPECPSITYAADFITPIRCPSGSVNWPMSMSVPGTGSGPMTRLPPRLSAFVSETSTSGTST
jgi:hypothetical protein